MTKNRQPTEAEKAVESAQGLLAEVRAESEEITEVTTDLADIRVKNHFAESFILAMELRKKKVKNG